MELSDDDRATIAYMNQNEAARLIPAPMLRSLFFRLLRPEEQESVMLDALAYYEYVIEHRTNKDDPSYRTLLDKYRRLSHLVRK